LAAERFVRRTSRDLETGLRRGLGVRPTFKETERCDGEQQVPIELKSGAIGVANWFGSPRLGTPKNSEVETCDSFLWRQPWCACPLAGPPIRSPRSWASTKATSVRCPGLEVRRNR